MASNLQFVDIDLQSAQKVINSPDPSAAQDVATKNYVDNYVQGLSWKDEVRVAATGNAALATAYENGDTVDGVVLVTGDRLLLPAQTTQTENGIYTVNASGAPTRALDANSSSELNNATVMVTDGTVNSGKTFTQTTKNPTLGSSNIVWVQYATGSTYVAGDGLTDSPAGTFNVADDGNGSITVTANAIKVNTGTAANTSLEVAGSSVRVASAGIGAGLTGGSGSPVIADNSITARWKEQVTHSSGTTVTFTHNLGRTNLGYIVSVYYTSSGATPGKDLTAGCSIVKSSNAVTVTFNASQSSNTIGIGVVG